MPFLSAPPASSFFCPPCLLYLGNVVTPEGLSLSREGWGELQTILPVIRKSPMLWGTPPFPAHAHPKPAFPVSSPEEDCVPPDLEKTHLVLFTSSLNSTRKTLLIGFKNRTPEQDFYGLVKSTVLVPTHTFSLPLPGPVQLPRSSSAQALQAPRQRLGRFTSSALAEAFSAWLPATVQLLSHSPCTHGWDILCLLF